MWCRNFCSLWTECFVSRFFDPISTYSLNVYEGFRWSLLKTFTSVVVNSVRSIKICHQNVRLSTGSRLNRADVILLVALDICIRRNKRFCQQVEKAGRLCGRLLSDATRTVADPGAGDFPHTKPTNVTLFTMSFLRKTSFAIQGHFAIHCFVTAVLWSIHTVWTQIRLKIPPPLTVLAGSVPELLIRWRMCTSWSRANTTQ